MNRYQLAFIIFLIALGAVLAPLQIEIEELTERLDAVQVQIDDLVMHSKTPCMTLPDNTPCWDKTVFRKLPGGSLQKELRRICAFKSPKAQVWKGE